jgi:GNAT superfamily N-acetyltransferase
MIAAARAAAPAGEEVTTSFPTDVSFRTARASDVDEITRLETASWPAGKAMRADADKFATRIRLGGVMTARREGRIVGVLTTFRPRWADAATLADLLAHDAGPAFALEPAQRWASLSQRWRLPADWHEATADGTLDGGRMHDPDGNVVFGVGLATDPQERGKSIAKGLLARALICAALNGARYFLGYGRLPQFHRSDAALDDYLLGSCPREGHLAPHDFGLRVHWSVGARPLAAADGRLRFVPIPRSMHDDTESRNAGALIVTPLGDREPLPFERVLATARPAGT